MSEFRPEDRPAQPRTPNAVCRTCGWLREVSWAAEAPPCPNCGGDRIDRLTGRALFLCRACSGLRLDGYGRCPVCRAEPPEPRPAPAEMAITPPSRTPAERSERKRKNFLHVIAAAMVEQADARAATNAKTAPAEAGAVQPHSDGEP